MGTREIVVRFIAPDHPLLARRILALLWSYERGQLRHRLLNEPIHRRSSNRREVPHADSRDRNL